MTTAVFYSIASTQKGFSIQLQIIWCDKSDYEGGCDDDDDGDDDDDVVMMMMPKNYKDYLSIRRRR